MYESSSERWSPVQSIEKSECAKFSRRHTRSAKLTPPFPTAVLLSVLSMLAEPNVESGANIDACVSRSPLSLQLRKRHNVR